MLAPGCAMNKLACLRSTFAELGWTTGLLYLVSVGLRRFVPFLAVEKYYVVAQPVAARAINIAVALSFFYDDWELSLPQA